MQLSLRVGNEKFLLRSARQRVRRGIQATQSHLRSHRRASMKDGVCPVRHLTKLWRQEQLPRLRQQDRPRIRRDEWARRLIELQSSNRLRQPFESACIHYSVAAKTIRLCLKHFVLRTLGNTQTSSSPSTISTVGAHSGLTATVHTSALRCRQQFLDVHAIAMD
eukprot:COSAG02_NODE_1257_length_13569_cov_5.370676_4_plen_164_part_00